MQPRPTTHIQLQKTAHRDHTIVLLLFQSQENWKNKIKALPSSRYSKSYGAYYIPYTSKAYKAFCNLEIPYQLPRDTVERSTPQDDNISIAATTVDASSMTPPIDHRGHIDISTNMAEPIHISWSAKGFVISIAYDHGDVRYLKQLDKCWWSKKEQKWIAKSIIDNLEKIQHRWTYYNHDQYAWLYEQISRLQKPQILELYTTPQCSGSLILKVKGYKSDAYIIKQYAHRQYDATHRRWILPYNDKVAKEIIDTYKKAGYTIINNIRPTVVKDVSDAQRKSRALQIFLHRIPTTSRKSIENYCDVIMRQGKSIKTAKDYSGALLKIMTHYKVQDLDQLSERQVNGYLSMLAKKGLSDSMLNRVVSAIKLWCTYVSTTTPWNIENIQRPKRYRKIPTVLSAQEMKRFIDVITNLKHLCMISTMYGSGLRVGELLDLQLKDVYWDRKQLHIKSAKGKKDRIVNMSEKLMDHLAYYFDQYQPARYLFEGTKKGQQYSYSSVRQFVHRYAKLARTAKKVTPHILRHSFATHLMDNGVALPYIQKLLGHKDIKTTLIYTHLSNDSIEKIRSPLDEL